MLVCPAEIRAVTLEDDMETERLLIDSIRETDKADYELFVSFQFHHTQLDGAHAGRFVENLQNEITSSAIR